MTIYHWNGLMFKLNKTLRLLLHFAILSKDTTNPGVIVFQMIKILFLKI